MAYKNLRESGIGHHVSIEYALKADRSARDQALADALVLAAKGYADDPDATDDVVMAENEILARLDVDPDETEQGMTKKASDLVYGFARQHTSDPELASRVFGPIEVGHEWMNAR